MGTSKHEAHVREIERPKAQTGMPCIPVLDAMLSLGLINTISKPTRNMNNSISLLDNIFVSNSMIIRSRQLYCDISDHFPVFAIVEGAVSNSYENERIQYRIINDSSLSNL